MISSTSSHESARGLSEAATAMRRRRVGPVVAASLGSGLATAAVFALVAFPGADEHVITGSALLAFAFGWQFQPV